MTASRVSPKVVTEAILGYLNRQNPPGTPSPSVEGSPHMLRRPWSTLYFVTVLDAGGPRKWVVKIIRFQDQERAEVSWQSENLLARGRREFDTLTRVSRHFAYHSNPFLRALRPVTYLAEINAVVMEFAEGTQMSKCIRVRHLITARGRRRAIQMVRHAGQWLRCFHTMRLDGAPGEGAFGPSDIFQALLDQVNHLRTLGVDLAGPLWDRALAALEHIPHEERVWCHGDYHLGNLMVLADSGVLGLDAVMDRVDSPYYDLGRFLGDLKTRRSTVLRLGLLPPPGITGELRDAFLDGYLDGAPYARLSLALYEGYFIVREWVDILIWVRDTFSGRTTLLGSAISRIIVNTTFHRIVRQWMQTVVAAR